MFEGLDVYQKSMQFVIQIYALNGAVRDQIVKTQLRRAALSIPLNIAEGQGRMHGREKRQFYNTARGSLLECVPLIQICQRLGYLNQDKYDQVYGLAEDIGKMLTKLVKSVKIDNFESR
jgi:four helix bundle protein